MNDITKLIIDYKKNNYPKLLDEIFLLLQSILKEKADYIYFQKWYPNNLYVKCKYCKKCKYNKERKQKSAEAKRRKMCDNCNNCICNKGYFNLKNNNLCDYKDVEQELHLEILRLINNFDEKVGVFKEYLSASLWDWRPAFIDVDFVEKISHDNILKTNEEGEEQYLEIEDIKSQENIHSNLNIEDILNQCKNENERKICESYLNNFNITEEELGNILDMTKQNISLILKKLRKRLKYYLTKSNFTL
jgi:hypothetical protein